MESNKEWSSSQLLGFAQLLFRCKLCRANPTILSSQTAFLKHMNDIHLSPVSSLNTCHRCGLKFAWEEDLTSHSCDRDPTEGHMSPDSTQGATLVPGDIDLKGQCKLSMVQCDPDLKGQIKPSKPRSRRKRTLPQPCRRNDLESNDLDPEMEVRNDTWFKRRFSLMESDRKRLTPTNFCVRDKSRLYLTDEVAFYIDSDTMDSSDACFAKESLTESVVDLSTKPHLENSAFGRPVDLSTEHLEPGKPEKGGDKEDKWKMNSLKIKRHVMAHRCHRCEAEFTALDDLCSHYKETHMGSSTSPLGDQYFKVIWLKHLLPQFLIARESGCVSRDELLERMSVIMDENALWGPACNKAIRETFPDSTAMRKGKFKKTYYFGVTYINSAMNSSKMETSDEDCSVDDEEDLHNIVCDQEVQKLVQCLPEVVQYTGGVDCSVSRDTILSMMSSKLGDPTVLSWLAQCNKAVTRVFPYATRKRKGKYKNTYYFGLELLKDGKSSTATKTGWMPSSLPVGSGPPVVNAMDLQDSRAPSHLSKLTSPNPSPPPADLSFLNDILKKPSNDNGPASHMVEKEPLKSSCSGNTSNSTSPVAHSLDKSQDKSMVNTRGPNSPSGVSSHLENIEKLLLLHSGPFVTVRIFSRRFQRLAPTTDKVLAAMNMLQSRGLGQVFTMRAGNSKVFFKAIPSKSLEVALSLLGVRYIDYQVMFSERDSKLEGTLHTKLKAFYPQPDLLSDHYKH